MRSSHWLPTEAWLQQVTADEPFGCNPRDKLGPLGTALQWSVNVGYAGPENPAVGEVFDTFVLPTMFASAATGRLTVKPALDEAHQATKKIFEKWRQRGMVGGGSRDRV